jgi:hypothetical protein
MGLPKKYPGPSGLSATNRIAGRSRSAFSLWRRRHFQYLYATVPSTDGGWPGRCWSPAHAPTWPANALQVVVRDQPAWELRLTVSSPSIVRVLLESPLSDFNDLSVVGDAAYRQQQHQAERQLPDPKASMHRIDLQCS